MPKDNITRIESIFNIQKYPVNIIKEQDFTTENIIKDFFNNLDVYEKQLKVALGTSKNLNDIDLNVINSNRRISRDEFSPVELAEMSKNTRMFKIIKECMLDWNQKEVEIEKLKAAK